MYHFYFSSDLKVLVIGLGKVLLALNRPHESTIPVVIAYPTSYQNPPD
jgi:hypothetical protein